VRIAVADENGYDGAALQALERSQSVQDEYQDFSDEALRLGVFGAPTFIIHGVAERFWGQDRLLFVDRALERLRGGAAR
jgi:2-hydroxychromene-2-carboxylate isomerase